MHVATLVTPTGDSQLVWKYVYMIAGHVHDIGMPGRNVCGEDSPILVSLNIKFCTFDLCLFHVANIMQDVHAYTVS